MLSILGYMILIGVCNISLAFEIIQWFKKPYIKARVVRIRHYGLETTRPPDFLFAAVNTNLT